MDVCSSAHPNPPQYHENYGLREKIKEKKLWEKIPGRPRSELTDIPNDARNEFEEDVEPWNNDFQIISADVEMEAEENPE